jgi:ferredoxin
MFERYHIPLRSVPSRAPAVPKYVIVRADNCINCGKCERSCIYGVHKRGEADPRKMADPINQLCKNCFRCIEDCPQRALTMSPGPEYMALARGIWTSQRLATIWGEAESGRIPVLGAGYRGMFAGPGYDGMWTDMSEIVRPTRDGIHGREYISTSVDVGRKPGLLEFDGDHNLKTKLPQLIELPIPVVLDATRMRSSSDELQTGLARSARYLNTLMFASPDTLTKNASSELNGHLVPAYPEGTDVNKIDLPVGVRAIELTHTLRWKYDLRQLRSAYPDLIISFRLPAQRNVERRVLDLARSGVDVAHVTFDEDGMEETDAEPRHSKESLRAIHKTLVSAAIRDEITVIAGGGIAAAEHVPKSIICGADVVALERALMIALECRNCITCSVGSCPVSLHSAPPEWVEGRVSNMVGAWRDQLLEVLGAMGLREVRRLRGEVGRAIFFEDVESESFADIPGGAHDG